MLEGMAERSSDDAWVAQLEWPPDARPIGCGPRGRCAPRAGVWHALLPHAERQIRIARAGACVRLRGRRAGLHNLGNTCFVNSVLQCLAHTPPLALGCLQLREDVLRALPGGMGSAHVMRMLADHIRDALTSDARPFTPSLATQMHEVSTYLTPGQQEDSHEFLRLLIDAASRQTPAERASANGARPFIEHLFLGQLQSSVRCTACGGVSRSADDFLDLSLEIGAEGVDADADGTDGIGWRRSTGGDGGADASGAARFSLLDALRAFLRTEQLDDADQYFCERCKAHVCAEKRLELCRLPPVLLLHLKRFRQQQWGRSKIQAHVSFPAVLDLDELTEGDGAHMGGGSDGSCRGAPGADARSRAAADGGRASGVSPQRRAPCAADEARARAASSSRAEAGLSLIHI